MKQCIIKHTYYV